MFNKCLSNPVKPCKAPLKMCIKCWNVSRSSKQVVKTRTHIDQQLKFEFPIFLPIIAALIVRETTGEVSPPPIKYLRCKPPLLITKLNVYL